jgi:glycosyltransferase involved in cell wall biosynthesis
VPLSPEKKIKLSILIPAYNEEKTIVQLLEQVAVQKIENVSLERIVIDDGSKDKTVQILKSRTDLYEHIVMMPRNGGKGAAVQAGLQKATGDFILFQDADLEYSPNEYSKLVMPVLNFDADIVMGSRFLAPQYTRVHYFWNRVGNWLITSCFNILYNKTFTDIYTCYFLFRRNTLNPDELRTFGFEQQAEILTRVVRRCKTCYEVPISYSGRTVEEGKKIKAWHALRVIWVLFTQRFIKISPLHP